MDEERIKRISKNLAIAAVIYFVLFIFIIGQFMISPCATIDCESNFFSGFFLGFIIPFLVIYYIVHWWYKK